MYRKETMLYIGLPVALLVLYTGGMILVPNPGPRLSHVIFSEQGIIEVGTAVCFFLAAIMAFFLGVKAKSIHVGKWKAAYLLVGLMALFVALEEINYGQYFFGFETPDQISELNTKGEFNLHNMAGNKPARRLNLIATVGFPVFFIILPLIVLRKQKTYLPHTWAYSLLPQRQLILFVVFGQLMSWFDDVFGFFGIANTWTRATEFKELYWSIAVLLWMAILYRRIVAHATVAGDESSATSEKDQEAEIT